MACRNHNWWYNPSKEPPKRTVATLWPAQQVGQGKKSRREPVLASLQRTGSTIQSLPFPSLAVETSGPRIQLLQSLGKEENWKRRSFPTETWLGHLPLPNQMNFLYHTITQIVILDQARKFSSSSNRKTGEDNSRRIKWPQTKDHTILTWSINTFTWIGALDAVRAV